MYRLPSSVTCTYTRFCPSNETRRPTQSTTLTGQATMTTSSNRDQVRSETAAGGWTVVWGDLINEWDAITFAVSLPTATNGLWVSQQVEAQLSKFAKSLGDVSDDILKQATEILEDTLKGRKSGEWDIDGLGIKGGIVTYKRWWKLFGIKNKLPNNHQPYIGLRVTKPLPPKGTPATPAAPISAPATGGGGRPKRFGSLDVALERDT